MPVFSLRESLRLQTEIAKSCVICEPQTKHLAQFTRYRLCNNANNKLYEVLDFH